MANQPTTLSQPESHLWEAANILRGPVDAADFKTYVFPLLFFKRIADVYDEEFAQFPQNYRFQIPRETSPKTTKAKVRKAAGGVLWPTGRLVLRPQQT